MLLLCQWYASQTEPRNKARSDYEEIFQWVMSAGNDTVIWQDLSHTSTVHLHSNFFVGRSTCYTRQTFPYSLNTQYWDRLDRVWTGPTRSHQQPPTSLSARRDYR